MCSIYVLVWERKQNEVVWHPSFSEEPPLLRMIIPLAAMTQVKTYRTNTNHVTLKMKD